MARPTSFDRRLVRYEEVHAIRPDDFRAFVDAAQIQGHIHFLDCGCGYGAVTRELLISTESARLCGDAKLVVDLIDESVVQLARAKAELHSWEHAPGVTLKFIEGIFPDDVPQLAKYNVIACKMVLHEVNKDQQLNFLEGAYRSLAPTGRLLLWEICLCPEIAGFFRSVVRLKDELSGYDTMVQRRNFLTETELDSLFSRSAFGYVDLARDFTYRFDTRKRFMPEFGGDEEKFARWHNFIREAAAALSPLARSKLRYFDDGVNIVFEIRKVIAIARKINPTPCEPALASDRVVT